MNKPLDFETFRTVNASRCVNGFKHTLASWSVAEWTNAMCGEAGEAANVAKKMLRFRDVVAGNKPGDSLDTLRAKLGRELADVVIYADLVASSQGLNLGELVRETFNAKSDELGAVDRLPAASIDVDTVDGQRVVKVQESTSRQHAEQYPRNRLAGVSAAPPVGWFTRLMRRLFP